MNKGGKFLFQEADFYGASKLIFLDKALPICYKATWMHGLGHIFSNAVSPDVLIHSNERSLPLHLVNNSDTVKLLKNKNAIAVGMPYIYTKTYSENVKVRKIYKRMFMPGHSILGIDYSYQYEDWRVILKKYKCDSICLGGADYEAIKNNNIFLGDIAIVRGAHAGDADSLNNIALMFYQTSEIITNQIGSHIVYAAASGVTVRIIDEISFLTENKEARNTTISTIVDSIRSEDQKSFECYLNGVDIDNIKSSVWFQGNQNEMKEYSDFVLGVEFKKSLGVMAGDLTPDNNFEKYSIFGSILLNKIRNKLS